MMAVLVTVAVQIAKRCPDFSHCRGWAEPCAHVFGDDLTDAPNEVAARQSMQFGHHGVRGGH